MNRSLTERKLIKTVARRNKIKQADAVIAILDMFVLIKETLAHGEPVEIDKFGSFFVFNGEERIGIKFKPERAFKDAVNGIKISSENDDDKAE